MRVISIKIDVTNVLSISTTRLRQFYSSLGLVGTQVANSYPGCLATEISFRTTIDYATALE